MPNNLSSVAEILELAGQYLLNLRADGSIKVIQYKPDGPVTTADLYLQEFITNHLLDINPSIPVIGEENSNNWHAAIIDTIKNNRYLWILDPLDGTNSYLSGKDSFGIQLALLHGDTILGGWIYCPALGRLIYAWDGIDKTITQGFKIVQSSVPISLGMIKAVIASGDFDFFHKNQVNNLRNILMSLRGTYSCAVDYIELISGEQDILLYRRTLPWDHAPGAYLAQLSGAVAIRHDRNPYNVQDGQGGILVMRTQELQVYQHLFLPSNE